MVLELVKLVEEAGKNLRKYYEYEDKQVSFKAATDLVTAYDKALEDEITQKCRQLFPDFIIVGEETSSVDVGLLPGKVIYIDPIDGTTNFVHKFKMNCISVGVFIDEQGFCGVVHSPMLEETFYAEKGKGAFYNGRPIKVSDNSVMIQSLFNTGFSSDPDTARKMLPAFENLIFKTRGVRNIGSAALSLCYVAQGIFDAYYGTRFKPWDIAAGILIVEEAGGIVTDADNKPHDLGLGFMLASNKILHSKYLQEINSKI